MGRRRLSVSPLVDALLSRDQNAAAGLAAHALDECGSRVSLVSDFMEPALYAISELWYQGAVHAADEKNASEIIASVLDELPPTPATEPVDIGSVILLAGLEGEEHLFGMRILSMVLRDQGWQVVVLPPAWFRDLVEVADELHPQVVGVSCGYLPEPNNLARAVAALQAKRCRVLVGGPAINRAPGLWSRLGADATGVDARVASIAARQQLAHWQRRAALEERFRLKGPPHHRSGRPGPGSRTAA